MTAGARRVLVLAALLLATGRSWGQDEARLFVQPLFLVVKGIGVSLDMPLSEERDWRVSVVVVNLGDLHYVGGGLGLIHHFDSPWDDRHTYANLGLSAGHLLLGNEDHTRLSGVHAQVHALVGRHLEHPGGLRVRFGVGGALGVWESHLDRPDGLGHLFLGFQPRFELAVGFAPTGPRYAPPDRW